MDGRAIQHRLQWLPPGHGSAAPCPAQPPPPAGLLLTTRHCRWDLQCIGKHGARVGARHMVGPWWAAVGRQAGEVGVCHPSPLVPWDPGLSLLHPLVTPAGSLQAQESGPQGLSTGTSN